MPTKFKSPFGAGPITGIIELENDRLVIEYERTRLLRKSRYVKIDIPVEEIDELTYRSGVAKNSLLLRSLYLNTTTAIPWSKSLEVKFVIPRKEKARAIELADRFEEYVKGSTSETQIRFVERTRVTVNSLDGFEISTQQANDIDLPELASLNIQLQLDEGSKPLSQKQAEARLKKWLSEEYSCYFFLRQGVRIGYILFRPTDSVTEGHPGGIVVRQFMILPANRREGLGTMAFECFLNTTARGKNILLDVMVSNPEAHKFWSRFGFKQYSVRYERTVTTRVHSDERTGTSERGWGASFS